MPTTLLISRRSPPTARCPSSGDWDYIPRHCSRMSCTRQTKQSRLWSMPVPRPTFKGIRWGRKWKLFQTVIPNTFKEAMTLPAKAHWKAASDKEVASLKKNNVYTLVPTTAVPAGHKIIGSRWVYKVKADKSYKGRVVVLGWGQVPGVDCGGTFAPVCRL